MNVLLMITFVALGLGSIFLLWKKDRRLIGMFNVLFATTLMQWAATLYSSNGALALHILTGTLVVGYLIAQFVPKKAMIGTLVSTTLVLVSYFTVGTGEMVLVDSPNVAESKFVITGILLASIGPYIVRAILDVLSKLVPALTPGAWSVSVYPLLAGIGFLLASIGSPVYGTMLVGAAFLLNSFFDNKRSGITGTSLFVLSAIPLLLLGESLNIGLLNADVIAGLFVGAFSIVLLNKLWSDGRNILLVLLAYGIIFAVIFGLTYNGTTYEQMGGLDAFVAILVSAALVNAIKGKTYQGVSLMAPLLALGLWVPSLLVNEEAEAADKKIIKIGSTTNEEGEEEEGPAALPIKELSGVYQIQPDASVVQFELGKEGARTKGQFKKVSGKFNITEDLSRASVNVTMKMADFTTFNSMRDESLRSDEYFNVKKFPKMTFQGKGFEDLGENLFKVKGTFTMLGKSNPVSVTMQRIELEGRIVFIGSGSLDRTEFGMQPSAAEGNVVDFNYQVDLSQK